MSFGLRTADAAGVTISQFDKDYLRFVTRVRVEANVAGSLQLTSDPAKTLLFFQADDPVQKTPPVITLTNTGLLSWRPYITSPSFHTGGYILVSVIST